MAAARERWLTEGLEWPDRPADSGPDHSLPIDYPPPIPLDLRVPEDSVVHRSAPPPSSVMAPPVEDELPTGEPTDRVMAGELEAVGTFAGLDLQTSRRDVGGKQRSAGMLGSILFHVGLVVLIALLVAPAHLGKEATHTLTMTMIDDAAVEPAPLTLMDQADDQDSDASDSALQNHEQPVKVSMAFAPPRITLGGKQSADGIAVGKQGGGVRGSFFGIEAKGHTFAYIVDRSGSMNGNRYQRAIDELKRSVRELKSHQQFMVVLFSDKTKLMFDQTGNSAAMVPATDANKDRLDQWLATIGTAGGTHPNASLRIALRMKPSAVFMLSDGEFSSSSNKKRGSLLSAGGNAFSIAEASGRATPIHSIAFEDPRSCENMKRLAQLTGGKYRFVNWAGKTQGELLADAQKLIGKPFSPQRVAEQSALCRQFGMAAISDNAKRVFSLMLTTEHEDKKLQRKTGTTDDLETIPELLLLAQSLNQIGPRHQACADLQDRIAGELSLQLGSLEDKNLLRVHLDTIVRWGTSPANSGLLNRLADHFKCLSDRPANESFARLQTIRALHPKSKATQICQEICDQAADSVLAESEQHLESEDLAAAIRTLRGARDEQQHPLLDTRIRERLRELTLEKLTEARDASQNQQHDRKTEIRDALERGFAGDSLLSQWRREFVNKELAARRLLQQTESDRYKKSPSVTQRRLQTIVRQYPKTLASRSAAVQLQSMTAQRMPADPEEAELIRMMDATPRR